MSETKFTSGPWHREGFEIKAVRGTITRIPTPQNGGVFDCNANARLIAAAPDLYTACAAFLEYDANPDYSDVTMMLDYADAIALAKAAIAKARGESPASKGEGE